MTSGDLQNFVGVHPSASTTIDDSAYELKAAMMGEFGHFDPRIVKIIGLSKDIKRWPLIVHEPLPTWVRGHVVLIGDAAHSMLPFGGQGATQAMEDGAALGALLKDVKGLDAALGSFEAIRKNRATRIQILSSVRAGLESQVEDKLTPYLDETTPKPPISRPARVMHDFRCDMISCSVERLANFSLCFSYDVYAACDKAIK